MEIFINFAAFLFAIFGAFITFSGKFKIDTSEKLDRFVMTFFFLSLSMTNLLDLIKLL
ncbi:hypothetical protein ZP9_00030 [Shewanella phage ZP9]|nr:hypothetical protein ZP9_00030 [Shewanella phage ZP9]